MIRHFKTGKTLEERAEDDSKVRAIVEAILADISARGDAAVVRGTCLLVDGGWTTG